MFRKYGKIMLFGCMLLLVACASTGNTSGSNGSSSSSWHGSASIHATVLAVVKPKSVHGSPGSGPIVVTLPTPMPGSNANSEQVVLKDRTLVITSVSKQNGPNAGSSLITLVLTVKNTSDKPIMNQSTFFQLTGPEGDTFTYQYNSSDNFYGTVSANSSRNGTIQFQVPRAATSNLRLLYHPEDTTETALVSLGV